MLMSRNKFYNVYLRHHLVLRCRVLWLKFKSLFTSDKAKIREQIVAQELKIGFSRVLNRGDIIAIQGGVCMDPYKRKRYWYDNWSQLWMIAKQMGPNGIVVAVEPNPEIAKKIEDVIAASDFKCKFVVVNKALSDTNQQTVKFQLGHNFGAARLHEIRNSEGWHDQEDDEELQIEVGTETIDNIIRDNNLDPAKVAFVNLTINGSEYEAIRGMENVLSHADNICVTAAAGREYEGVKGKESQDIGFIDGKPDHEVMSQFLQQFGFSTNLVRYKLKQFGLLVSVKGNQKPFMQ